MNVRHSLVAAALTLGTTPASLAATIYAEFGGLGPIAVEELQVSGITVTGSDLVTAGWINPAFGLGVQGGNSGMVNGGQSLDMVFESGAAYNITYRIAQCQSLANSPCAPRSISVYAPSGELITVLQEEGLNEWFPLSTLIDNAPVGRIVFRGDDAFPSIGFRVRTVRYSLVPDTDGDGHEDIVDNCAFIPNSDQRDTNGDNIGNVCDADINGDCLVNVVDLGLLRDGFFTDSPDLDFDGDGAVNFVDLGIMRSTFFERPGLSGYPRACNTNPL